MSEQPLTIDEKLDAIMEQLKPMKDELAAISKEFQRGGIIDDMNGKMDSILTMRNKMESVIVPRLNALTEHCELPAEAILATTLAEEQPV